MALSEVAPSRYCCAFPIVGHGKYAPFVDRVIAHVARCSHCKGRALTVTNETVATILAEADEDSIGNYAIASKGSILTIFKNRMVDRHLARCIDDSVNAAVKAFIAHTNLTNRKKSPP